MRYTLEIRHELLSSYLVCHNTNAYIVSYIVFLPLEVDDEWNVLWIYVGYIYDL